MPLYKAWVYIIQISIGTVGLSAAHRAGTPCVIKKKEKEKKNSNSLYLPGCWLVGIWRGFSSYIVCSTPPLILPSVLS